MSKTETDNAIFAKIPLDQLMVTEQNARQFNDNNSRLRLSKFNELVASIREQGIIEPVVVREIAEDQYQIIAGERRYRAAAKVAADAGIAPFYYQVPCMIRQADDDEAFDLALIENLQREDLSPFEAASAFKDYLGRHADNPDSVSDLAARTGIPAHAIRRQVRLLNLPTEVLNVWGDGTITTTHVEALTRIDDRDICLQVLGECLRRKLSARELREHINGISPDLDKGFFDKTECQTCPSNTSLQSGLFAEEETDGKCINPSCFEKKQSTFLTETGMTARRQNNTVPAVIASVTGWVRKYANHYQICMRQLIAVWLVISLSQWSADRNGGLRLCTHLRWSPRMFRRALSATGHHK